MSSYLKMDDGFYDLDVGYLEQRLFSGLVSKEECTYAAHAINSHDELVQQRDELLAALEGLLADMRLRARMRDDIDADGTVVLDCGTGVLMAVDAAIAKATGGAA